MITSKKFVSCATEYLLYFLIVLIPFSVRYVFDSPLGYQTGAYSDFTSLSMYASDFILISILAISLVALVFHMKHATVPLPRLWLYSALAAIAWLIVELCIQDKNFFSLQLYFSTRFILLILFAIAVSQIKVSREKLAWVFAILGAIQGMIATLQFYFQKSLGLYLLGESHLSPDTLGVAKIVAHGTKMIRGYGTFPHANLLAAFLVISTLLNLYLVIINNQKSRGVILYILLFINIFGLYISLSRGGYLAVAVGLVSFGTLAVLNRTEGLKKAFIAIVASFIISITILFPYLNTRASISDNAIKERLFYNEIGQNMIDHNSIAGVGPGTSVLHMKQYTQQYLEPWEIQPIHNYWLILWSEWGIGSVAIIILLICPIFALFKRYISLWTQVLASIGLSIFALFMFDHYFYTIWPTQMLLWLFIGLIMRELYVKAIYDMVSQPK